MIYYTLDSDYSVTSYDKEQGVSCPDGLWNFFYTD